MKRLSRIACAGLLVFAVAGGIVEGAGAAAASSPVTPPVFDIKWGSRGTAAGQVRDPAGVAVGASGNVYVADAGNDRIQEFNSSGDFITMWGSHGTGDGQFDFPWGVAVDASGNVYVTDANNSRVQKFDNTGTFLTAWGSYGTGDGQFRDPYGIEVDAAGNVHVADVNNNRIQTFDSSGNFLATFGSSGSGDGQFYQPVDVAFDASGNVYVADASNERIQEFTSSGVFVAMWGSTGSFGTADGQFNTPMALSVDASGIVYVADSNNGRIQEFDSSGTFLTKWGSYGEGDGQFAYPYGLAIDASGNVFVVDGGNSRVQKFKPVSAADTTPPSITLTTPSDGASYTLGQVVNADYSCDDGSGSGAASCDGDVASLSPIDTSTAGSHTFTVNAADVAGNHVSPPPTHNYQVLAGNLPSEPVPPSGGSFTTDPGNLGATAQVPLQTAIEVPATTPGGAVEVSTGPATAPPPTGYFFLGQQVTISVPASTDPAHPLVLRFSLDASLSPDPSIIHITRNGVQLDPCDATRSNLPCEEIPTSLDANGDLTIVAYTLAASRWNFAVHAPFAYQGFQQPVDNPPTLNSSKAGSAIPVKFSLGSNQGLGVLAKGYPASQKVVCASGAPIDEIEQTVTAGASSLSVSATGLYTYTWTTDKAWAGTYRTLTVKLADGSSHVAKFKFK